MWLDFLYPKRPHYGILVPFYKCTNTLIDNCDNGIFMISYMAYRPKPLVYLDGTFDRRMLSQMSAWKYQQPCIQEKIYNENAH